MSHALELLCKLQIAHLGEKMTIHEIADAFYMLGILEGRYNDDRGFDRKITLIKTLMNKGVCEWIKDQQGCKDAEQRAARITETIP